MPKIPFQIGSLGEVAIRCSDMESMCRFYGETLGLDLLPGNDNSDIVFFKISDGFAGHTNVVALFKADDSSRPQSQDSALHHLALSLSWSEQELAIEWFSTQEVPFELRDFDWIGWRGLFLTDPEQNIVELVAKRPSSLENSE